MPIVIDEAFHSSTGSGYEQAINEAMMDESEYRARHFSAGTSSSAMGPHQTGAARSRAMHSSIYRQSRHVSGSEPIAAGRPQSSSPAPNSSSPESRGQRVRTAIQFFFDYHFFYFTQLIDSSERRQSFVLIRLFLDVKTIVLSIGLDGRELVSRLEREQSSLASR